MDPHPEKSPPAEAEVVVHTQTWLERAVIGLNLCPFAKAVHVKRQIRYTVSFASDTPTLIEALEKELRFLAVAEPDRVDTTLLMHPNVLQDFIEFHFFLQEADALLRRMGLEGAIQIASFHPHFQFAGTDADDISNLSNRAPYPTLHLLREASVDRAVAAFPDAASIYDRNIETLERLGRDGWAALWPPRQAGDSR